MAAENRYRLAVHPRISAAFQQIDLVCFLIGYPDTQDPKAASSLYRLCTTLMIGYPFSISMALCSTVRC
ncbi:MAG: hypothetical protein GX199_03165 [Firmicutes bacterium]|nr:hypothetical protein [Bacillota bacterium]